MLQVRTGGVETEAAGFYLTADLRLDKLEQFLVRVELIRADVDGKFAAVGNDVVLRAGMYNCHTHLYRAEEVALFRELVCVEPFDVFHGECDGVDTFVAGGMSGLAGTDTVQHHQPFFRHSRLHPCRFADNGKRDRRQVSKRTLQSVLSRNLFFAGS